MTSLLVTSLPHFKFWKKDVFCIDDPNCECELGFWFLTKHCLNQSDDVTNVFDDVTNVFVLMNQIVSVS